MILTNLLDHRAGPRAAQLKAVGIDFPVYTNQGGKGEALGRILEEYKPSVAVFVDDLGHQHDSVGEHHPHVWRLHFVGEPLLWERVNSSKPRMRGSTAGPTRNLGSGKSWWQTRQHPHWKR